MNTLIDTCHIISKHGFADIVLNTITNQKSLNAAKPLEKDEVIASFFPGEISATPTYLTVQTDKDTHITLRPEFLQYINHSCNPNVFFDTTAMRLICVKSIKKGEELRFFYPSTEWQMTQEFVCNCGAANCLQLIKGAAYLTDETLGKYRLSNFIQQQLTERK